MQLHVFLEPSVVLAESSKEKPIKLGRFIFRFFSPTSFRRVTVWQGKSQTCITFEIKYLYIVRSFICLWFDKYNGLTETMEFFDESEPKENSSEYFIEFTGKGMIRPAACESRSICEHWKRVKTTLPDIATSILWWKKKNSQAWTSTVSMARKINIIRTRGIKIKNSIKLE